MKPEMVTLPSSWFKVRPIRRSPKYFAVHVAPTLAALRREMRKHSGGCHSQQLAAVHAVTGVDDPHIIGIIYFAKSRLGAGIVAHEMVHAALRTMERIRGPIVTTPVQSKWASTHPSEEQLCRMVELLNSAFWYEFYRQERRSA